MRKKYNNFFEWMWNEKVLKLPLVSSIVEKSKTVKAPETFESDVAWSFHKLWRGIKSNPIIALMIINIVVSIIVLPMIKGPEPVETPDDTPINSPVAKATETLNGLLEWMPVTAVVIASAVIISFIVMFQTRGGW